MALDFLSGLAQGFVNNQRDRLAMEEKQGLRKLQEKMFKRQLDMLEEQDLAKKKLFEFLGGAPTQTDDLGLGMPQTGEAPKPKSLLDALADPQGQMLAIQSGLMKAPDVLKSQQPNQMQQLLQMIQRGGGAPGGLELQDVIVQNGQVVPKFGRPQVWKEVPSPDGMSMIMLSKTGQELGRRPISPGEMKPQERSKGQTSIDTKFADEYVSFKAAGGYADIEKQLEQLRETSMALETEKGLTGGLVPGVSPGMTPEAVLKRINPRAIEIRDNVLDSAQRNLRLILGAQFTEREGEKLLSRVYDMALEPAQNKKRVDRLINQIRSAAKAKQEAINYFEEHGTLEGFKGKLWTLADFEPEPIKASDKKPSLDLGKKKESDPLGLR